jgi:hypothetical protein
MWIRILQHKVLRPCFYPFLKTVLKKGLVNRMISGVSEEAAETDIRKAMHDTFADYPEMARYALSLMQFAMCMLKETKSNNTTVRSVYKR